MSITTNSLSHRLFTTTCVARRQSGETCHESHRASEFVTHFSRQGSKPATSWFSMLTSSCLGCSIAFKFTSTVIVGAFAVLQWTGNRKRFLTPFRRLRFAFVFTMLASTATVANGQLQGSFASAIFSGKLSDFGTLTSPPSEQVLLGNLTQETIDTSTVKVEAEDEAQVSGGEFLVNAFAKASPGEIGVSIRAVGSTSATRSQTLTFNGQAKASWYDSVFITVPGMNGNIGFLSTLDITGNMRISGTRASGQSTFRLRDADGSQDSLFLAPEPEFLWGPNVYGVFDTSSSTDIAVPETIVTTHICHTGFACRLGYVMEVFSQGGTASLIFPPPGITGSLVSTATYASTVKWGGITSVFDANTGEPITNWTIRSESGFDYSRSFDQQVPEPSSILLLCCGVCAFMRRVRGNNKRTVPC